jgi:RimJ/RimL family protein N-acetyltransferase
MPDPSTFPVPTLIETPRLQLRPFATADAAALHGALAESLDALRTHLWFLPWVAEAQTLQSAEVRCRKAQANFLLRTDLAYLAFEKDGGRLVASFGLHRTDWTLPKTEVGYWVRSSATGRGYAREGVLALTAWAFDGLGAQRVELVTDSLNEASRAVAERCGFRLEGLLHNVMRGPDGSLRHSCIYARLPTGPAPTPARDDS